MVELPGAYLYFDVAFVVVLSSLLVQGWTVALAARKLDISFSRSDPLPRRVELDLPGQLAREIVGYPVSTNSPYLRRGLFRPGRGRHWSSAMRRSSPRQKHIRCVRATTSTCWPRRKKPRRSTASSSKCQSRPRPIRGCSATFSCREPRHWGHWPKYTDYRSPPAIWRLHSRIISTNSCGAARGPAISLNSGPIALLAHKVGGGRVITVGLRLAEPESPTTWQAYAKAQWDRIKRWLG